MAELVNEINRHNPTVMALDIIFPEKDRTSPNQMSSFYKTYLGINANITGIPDVLYDNDAILSSAFKSSKSVLSLYLSHNYLSSEKCNYNNLLGDIRLDSYHIEKYPYILCNINSLSSGYKNFGYINITADSDGVFRRYPFFKMYEDKLIPSLGLATLLSVNADIQVNDEQSIEVLNHKVALDYKSNALLNFYDEKWYKKISALDVLKKKTSLNEITGKIVLIGSSAVALHDQVVISGGNNIAGVITHATMIDNLLHDDLLVQKMEYQGLNVLFSLLLSLLLFFLLVNKKNAYIIILFGSVLIVANILNIYTLYYGNYISIGYLLIPFLLHFFLISILFIFIDTNDRKVFSEELNRSHVALLDSMVHVAEVHDLETGAHIIRTKKYIESLSNHIYSQGIYKDILSKDIIKMMYLTAPMHDIGKVGIPDAILKKEGQLTPMEYEVMKTHANLGVHIIDNAISSYHMNDFFKMAKNIAHYHHEKWDGSGYPDGLKGEEIPIEARFMALADVYDALVSRRVYKEPFTYEKTIGIILDGRATQFDPVLIDAFVELSDEFQSIAEKHSDQAYGE